MRIARESWRIFLMAAVDTDIDIRFSFVRSDALIFFLVSSKLANDT